MTLEEYIINPMGKSNAVFNSVAREAIAANYRQKFEQIMMREHGIIKYQIYRDMKNNEFYIHLKIPSEVVNKFYYDTVIKFYANENVKESGKNLLKYNVQFFSNDPSFVYTYSYVFMKNNLFIESLRSKMSKEARNKAPEHTNPGNNVGYVKSIYFAYLYMRSRDLFNYGSFTAQGLDYKPRLLANDIMNADDKIQLRQEEGQKVAHQKAKEKKNNRNTVPTVNKTTPSTTNKKIGTIKAVNTIKPISGKSKIKASTSNSKKSKK